MKKLSRDAVAKKIEKTPKGVSSETDRVLEAVEALIKSQEKEYVLTSYLSCNTSSK
jgi:hypothetical protein